VLNDCADVLVFVMNEITKHFEHMAAEEEEKPPEA